MTIGNGSIQGPDQSGGAPLTRLEALLEKCQALGGRVVTWFKSLPSNAADLAGKVKESFVGLMVRVNSCWKGSEVEQPTSIPRRGVEPKEHDVSSVEERGSSTEENLFLGATGQISDITFKEYQGTEESAKQLLASTGKIGEGLIVKDKDTITYLSKIGINPDPGKSVVSFTFIEKERGKLALKSCPEDVVVSKDDVPKLVQMRRDFENLPGDAKELRLTYKEALKTENFRKNQYGNVLACDRTRFIPKGVPYFNGNTIQFDQRVYIAAQGPTKEGSFTDDTRKDFWQAIVHGDGKSTPPSTIVNLAMDTEKGRYKYENYWSKQTTLDDGTKIELKSEKSLPQVGSAKDQYTIERIFTVTSPNSKPREVKQFHYQNWPDHGIPDIKEFNQLQDHVNSSNPKGSPIVVHCSAGIGRTGTYIAVDTLRDKVQNSAVNEIGTLMQQQVIAIRKQRHENMVQTEDQYLFAGLALLSRANQSPLKVKTEAAQKTGQKPTLTSTEKIIQDLIARGKVLERNQVEDEVKTKSVVIGRRGDNRVALYKSRRGGYTRVATYERTPSDDNRNWWQVDGNGNKKAGPFTFQEIEAARDNLLEGKG